MLSVPQRVKAMDSGLSPCFWSLSNKRPTTTKAVSTAAFVGIDWGSRACMFLPVGSTSGFRIGSPPGPGSMNSPLSARTRLGSSLLHTISLRQTCKYSKRGFKSFSAQLGKPALARARYQGEPPMKKFAKSWNGLGGMTRPSSLVLSDTSARTAARLAMVISCKRLTSSRTPLSAFRYTVSASEPMDSAMIFGKPLMFMSGRSN
mmetsp:Transcript_68140/g.190257  ORF Transcript_68140/g.190257 Transcript_68140/m.190257 type:complete len:204 (-) Transcript_68140:67-678(-)